MIEKPSEVIGSPYHFDFFRVLKKWMAPPTHGMSTDLQPPPSRLGPKNTFRLEMTPCTFEKNGFACFESFHSPYHDFHHESQKDTRQIFVSDFVYPFTSGRGPVKLIGNRFSSKTKTETHWSSMQSIIFPGKKNIRATNFIISTFWNFDSFYTRFLARPLLEK